MAGGDKMARESRMIFNTWRKKTSASIYNSWLSRREIKAKLSEKELAMAEKAAEKRKEGLTWGPMFQEERTYFPYKMTADPLKPPGELRRFLDSIGYEIIDYRQGTARKKDKNQPIGIGKILSRENKPALKKIFDERLQGAIKEYNQSLLVVFSHNPEDIAASSTDRGWTSCVDLRGGAHHEQMFNKIARGGLVIYLVREDDKNIEQPLARISTRRYEDNKGNFIFVGSDICYGVKDEGFIKFANDKLSESNNITGKNFSSKSFKDVEKGYLDVFQDKFSMIDYISMYADSMTKEQAEYLEDMVIKSKDANAMLYFAKTVPNADIHLLQNAIIKTKKAKEITEFASDVNGADVPLLQQVVETYGTPSDLYRFARDVSGRDMQSLINAFLAKKPSAEDIYHFAFNVDDKYIPLLEDNIIKSNEKYYIYNFARGIIGANIKRLQNEFIKHANGISDIAVFSREVNGADSFADMMKQWRQLHGHPENYNGY